MDQQLYANFRAASDKRDTQPPRLLAVNLLRSDDATVTVSAETATTGVKENAYAEGLTYDAWLPGSSGEHWLRASFSRAYDGKSKYVGDETIYCRAVTFTRDGSRMIVLSRYNHLYGYKLDRPWDASSARYVDDATITGPSSNCQGVALTGGGLKLYVHDAGADKVYRYSLVSPGVLDGLTKESDELDVSTETGSGSGIAVKEDGTKILLLSSANVAYQYSMSTPHLLTSASYDSKSLDVSGECTVAIDLGMDDSGTRLRVIDYTTDVVYSYRLTADWDLAAAAYMGTDFDLSVGSEMSFPHGMAVRPDGSQVYALDDSADTVFQYVEAVHADAVAVAAHDLHNNGGSFRVQRASTYELYLGGGGSAPRGAFFANSGKKLYVCFSASNTIRSYTLVTAYDLSTASLDAGSIDTSSLDTPVGVTIGSSGTKLFWIGDGTYTVYSYTMSTAYDLSTASYDGAGSDLDVSGFSTGVSDLFAGNSGATLFVVGYFGNKVGSWTLSTPWDLSTATYDGAGSDLVISGQDAVMNGITVHGGGEHLYMCGTTNNKIYKYTMSTPWDLSTATYDGSGDDVDLSDFEDKPQALAISDDGHAIFVIGTGYNSVVAFNMDTANDLSTAERFWWQDASVEYSPDTSSPAMLLFDADPSLHWRIVFDSTSALSVGVACIGKALEFNSQLEGPWSPPYLSRQNRYIPAVSEGGSYLGSSIIAEGAGLSLRFPACHLEWLRDQWEAHVRLLEQYGFFFCARDLDPRDGAEIEVIYAWITAQPYSDYQSNVYGSAIIQARGIIA